MRSLLLALAMTWPLLAAAELSVELPAAAASSAPSLPSLSTPAEHGGGMETAAEIPAADADPPPEAAFAEHQVVATVQGHASFYASRLQGRRTASGERYDPTALTAAHRSLPFGTWVRVQSLHSGQAIHVRINDRGPFIRGRLIDLSRAAAEALDMVGAGSHAVKVQVLRAP